MKKKLFIYGCIISIGITLYAISYMKGYGGKDLYGLYVLAYGHISAGEILHIYPILIWILPQLIIIYSLGSYLIHDLHQYGPSIFTRTAKRQHFFYSKMIDIGKNVVGFYLLQLVILILLGYIFGFSLEDSLIKGWIEIFALNVMNGYMMVLAINVLTLFWDYSYSALLIIGLNITNLYGVGFIIEHDRGHVNSFIVTPFIQSTYAWHRNAVVPEIINRELVMGSLYTIPYSLIYMLIIIGALLGIGAYRMKHMDIY